MNQIPLPTEPRVAVSAVVFHNGKILLVKRSNPPQQGIWAIPGGSIKLGETLQAAAEREIMEETGLTIKAGEAIHTFEVIDRSLEGEITYHYVVVDLEAEYISGEITPSDDAEDAGWFTPGDLKTLKASSKTLELLRKIGFII